MNPLMDELTFRSYAHNRMMFPDVQPERWAAIFQNVPAMEERFLKTFIAKLMQEIEVADQGNALQQGIESLRVGSCGEATASPLQNCALEDYGTEVAICGSEKRQEDGTQLATIPAVSSNEASRHAYNPRAISLPVPLGREGVSGSTRPAKNNGNTSPNCNPPQERGISDSQIFSYFPLAEIVEKVFKQRSFLCN